MTTNTTNSQAPEILAKQVAEWRKEVARLNDLIAHAEGRDSQAASIDADPYFCKLLSRIAEFGFTGEHDKALIARIDAYTAAAVAREREEGRLDGYNKGWADASLTLIKAESRATAAESRLAEIQRGVEGLDRYEHWDAWGASGTTKAADGDYVKRDEILALLQPQGQADTSGLSG